MVPVGIETKNKARDSLRGIAGLFIDFGDGPVNRAWSQPDGQPVIRTRP